MGVDRAARLLRAGRGLYDAVAILVTVCDVHPTGMCRGHAFAAVAILTAPDRIRVWAGWNIMPAGGR